MFRRRESVCREKRLAKRGNAPRTLFAPKFPFLRFSSCMLLSSASRSAALAVAEAFEKLVQEGDARIPANTRIEVLDILDYGRVPLDGDKTASMFTRRLVPYTTSPGGSRSRGVSCGEGARPGRTSCSRS